VDLSNQRILPCYFPVEASSWNRFLIAFILPFQFLLWVTLQHSQSNSW
jgi:hypothetical protein